MNPVNLEEHKQRHIELHSALDELVADMLLHERDVLISKLAVMELIYWSYAQTKKPSEPELHVKRAATSHQVKCDEVVI